MCYIASSCGLRMTGWVGDDASDVSLNLFTDADFAGDVCTQRSTTGIHLALHGKHTYFPLHGQSKKQTAVAFSTPEAELIAGVVGYQKTMIPALDLWEAMCPNMSTPMFHEDNQAMILVVNSGRNPTMRHIGRVHRVSLSWIHERLGRHKDRDETVLFYQTSENMSADIYTKSFKEKGAWVQAQRLINIFGPDELNASSIEQWMWQREELANKPAEDIDNRAGWSKAGKRKAKAIAGLATLADPGTRSRATQTGLM